MVYTYRLNGGNGQTLPTYLIYGTRRQDDNFKSYKKTILLVPTFFLGETYFAPPFNPPNPVSSGLT